MSNLEAVEQLAKAMDHISEAKEKAERKHTKREIENLENQAVGVMDGLICDIGDHQNS